MVVWKEERRLLGCFAVPAAVFELLLQELIGERFIRLFEIGTDAEDSAVDARLGFAVKEGPVVEGFEDESFVDAVDHCASLGAGGVETEVLQYDETVESDSRSRTSRPGRPSRRQEIGAREGVLPSLRLRRATVRLQSRRELRR